METAIADTPPVAARLPDLGARYRMIGVLGKGGMGEVFRAFDTELGGDVALKIVRGEVTDDSLARFRREIALARKVTSPHVLRVYDLGEHQGTRFVSMEYVDGSDLAVLLARDGRMPLARALELFRQVCLGLAAAHAVGVVHRDLKPQNVLVERDGPARVADFGLARSLGDSGLTATGAVLGSPAYMSPEQVKGELADERSDIYSLGVMLYQLATGVAPFVAETAHAMMSMRLHVRPRPLREHAPDVPAHIEAAALRCLEIDPAKRFTSVTELLAALDGASPAPRRGKSRVALAAGAGAIAAAAIALVIAKARGGAPSDTTAPTRGTAAATTPDSSSLVQVLVLGFANHASDPVFDSTLDSVMFYALRRSHRLDPVSAASLPALATELKGAVDDKLAAKLAERDHVRVISVRGEVASKGGGFSVSMTATDADGTVVLQQTLDAPNFDRTAAATARLAAALREALGEHVEEAEREESGLSRSLEADHEYAVGLAMQRAGESKDALAHYEAALAKDATFALVHVRLGALYQNDSRLVKMREEFETALRGLDKLNERDRWTFLGDYYQFATSEYDRALASYQQILAVWPKDRATEISVMGVYLARYDAKHALEAAKRAAADFPTNRTARLNLIAAMVAVNDFSGAVAETARATADFPRQSPKVPALRGLALALLDDHDGAAKAYADPAIDPSDAIEAQADLAFAEGRLGDAQALIERGLELDTTNHHDDGIETKHVLLARIALRRGDTARARAEAALVQNAPERVFDAALVQIAAGDPKPALATAAKFATDVAPERRAMAKLLVAEATRVAGKPADAIPTINEAIALTDMPIAHVLLGRALLDAGRPADADAELAKCIARRGELALGADGIVSVHLVSPLYYYIAQARQGDAAMSAYRAFLATARAPESDHSDPLVTDARRHVR